MPSSLGDVIVGPATALEIRWTRARDARAAGDCSVAGVRRARRAAASWCAELSRGVLAPGEFVAILGRNGSGKTLTLHTLAGLRAPAAGEVRLDGTPLASLSRRAVALRLGLLTQDLEDAFATTALEIRAHRPPPAPGAVAVGDAPRTSASRARRSPRSTWQDFATRRTDTLSGGEQRRVAVAALLAQAAADLPAR